jgi:hypothetical protein
VTAAALAAPFMKDTVWTGVFYWSLLLAVFLPALIRCVVLTLRLKNLSEP